MNLAVCRYNSNHKIRVTKLLKHEEACPDRSSKNLQKCPYNPVHLLNPDRFNAHLEVCPNRPIINKEVANEIRSYIESQNKEKERIKHGSDNTSLKDTFISATTKITKATKPTSRSGVTVGNIIGMNDTSKQDKLERKAKDKEMRRLLHGSAFQDSRIILEENHVDGNFELDDEEDNNQIMSKGTGEMVLDEFSISELREQDDYDPNESEIRRDHEVKNIIPSDFSANKQGTIHMVLRMNNNK
jgi:hypothetical protein